MEINVNLDQREPVIDHMGTITIAALILDCLVYNVDDVFVYRSKYRELHACFPHVTGTKI